MNENHKELMSIGLTLAIISITIYITHRFIPSLVWGSIIVIATYPLYKRWRAFFGFYHNLSALLFTFFLSLIFLLPLSYLVGILVKELQLLINYLQYLNQNGGTAPDVIKNFPLVNKELVNYWDMNIGKPGYVRALLSNLHISLTPTSYYIKRIGSNIAHRSFQLGFTTLTLFFLYRDGDKLIRQIYQIGEFCLGPRWFKFANKLPSALRGIVNGTIFVGFGVGLLMGICYAIVGLPGPTLAGFITAFAAMIPFAVPIVFVIIALILFSAGALISAIIVLAWGTFVMFTADHFVKPVLIGGAIKLPFLAVLFGILGGLETLGLLGLFIGPLIMVLFVTLWQEPQEIGATVSLKHKH